MDNSSLAFSRLVHSVNELGAIVSNVQLIDGEFGRGLLQISNEYKCRIPSSLFFPINAVRLQDGVLDYNPSAYLSLTETSPYSPCIKQIITDYLHTFVFSTSELKKWSSLWIRLIKVPIERLRI